MEGCSFYAKAFIIVDKHRPFIMGTDRCTPPFDACTLPYIRLSWCTSAGLCTPEDSLEAPLGTPLKCGREPARE